MAEEDTSGTQEKIFDIRKIYVKDASLEAPNSPAMFPEASGQEWSPEVQIQLASAATKVGDDLHEVVLTITATANVDASTAYLIEVHQAGLFITRGFSGEELGHLLGSFCPTTLFPFAREAIASMVGKAGYPKLYIKPVNFDVLYMQKMQRIQAETGHAGEPAS
jgi:preprotein translocase subunit SecB